MVQQIWVNIGSGNDFFPDDTKIISLNNVDLSSVSSVTSMSGKLLKRYLNHQSLELAWKLLIQAFIKISQGPMS